MRHAASVPNLAEEDASLGVHGLHNGLPRKDLLRSPDAGDMWIPDPRLRHGSGFCDEKTTFGCALRVVKSGVLRLRHIVKCRPVPGEISAIKPSQSIERAKFNMVLLYE